jgi:peptide deformylase
MVYIAPNSHEQFFLINPKIVEVSERQVLDTEGCLSLPNIYGTVVRPEMVVVQAYDEHGNQIELEVDKLTSRVIQHEIDHIDGVLFIDKLVMLTDGQEKLAALQNKAQDDER